MPVPDWALLQSKCFFLFYWWRLSEILETWYLAQKFRRIFFEWPEDPSPVYGVNKENYVWSLITLSFNKSWCQFDIVMTLTWCLIYRHITHDCGWADNGIVQCQVQGISSQMALADSRTTGLDNVSISHASGTMRTHQSRGLKIYKSES